MANFTPSDLVNGQAVFNEKFLGGEWRKPDIAALKTAELGEIANPSLKDLRTREDRQTFAYFPVRQAATGGTSRAHNHTGARGDSAAQEVTWDSFVEPFSISQKQLDNNKLSFAEAYASSLKNAIYNLLNRVDAQFVVELLADKTQVNVGGGNGAFAGTNDYEVTAGFDDYFYQEIKTMLEQNLYGGSLVGIVDAKGKTLANKQAAQGGSNATNLQFQFMGYEDIVGSTRTILSGYKASGIFFESGLVAYMPWIPRQNRKPLDPEKAMSYVGDAGSISIPDLGIDFAIHSYAARADTSSSGGNAQDVVIYQEVSIDMGYASAPLGTSRGSNDSVVYTAGLPT